MSSSGARADAATPARGTLVVVGTGIRALGHVTMEAIAWMQKADALPYLVGDPVAEALVRGFNPTRARSLAPFYKDGEHRSVIYAAIVEDVLGSVRLGHLTVMACYGHPAVCAEAPHECVRLARAEGHEARMLPGVSSLDCLFADLGIDPGEGCQTFEATSFFERECAIDPSCHLVLWQINAFGHWTHQSPVYDTARLPLLVEKLAELYPPTHVVTLYEASPFVGREPTIERLPLAALASATTGPGSTLYVPPARRRSSDTRWAARLA